MTYPTEWRNTDPDTNQWGRQLSENIFEFKQDNLAKKTLLMEDPTMDLSGESDTIQFEVDLSDYTLKAIENYTSSFYKSLHQLITTYQNEWKWIVAECIFETEA